MPVGERRRQRIGTRSERLEARISRDMKALCQKAASIQGSTLTDFIINSSIEAAKRIVRENELVELTHRDRVAFAEALLNPPVPNKRLRKAAQRHAQVFEG